MDFPRFIQLHIKDRILLNEKMREEFDEFFKKWIEKYNLSGEAYRSISYLMSSYVSNRDRIE